MKILYHFRTKGTGAEGVHIAGIASAFKQLGHEVVFASPTGANPLTTAGADPFGTSKRRSLLSRVTAWAPPVVFELLEILYNRVWGSRLRGLLRKERPDLIYERHAFFLSATARLAEQHGVPLIVEVNELAGDERVRAQPWFSGLARAADRFTFARARRIVVVSPHLKRRIVEMGVEEEKVLVLPNAVSEEMLAAAVEPEAVRERLGCRETIVVGFVGWFVAWHRLEVLLAQFAPLARKEPRLRLVLVGNGPLKEALASQAAELGMADRVIFTGPVPHAEVPSHIAAFDIAVVPHSNEYRSPIKLFECMALGRAVVAPGTEPIAQVIRDGENGVLFDPEKPESLGERLAALISDEELRERLGARARADVAERHTWLQNARATLAG
jgi:glycosyltransferase involved in cell wall biosynthesis